MLQNGNGGVKNWKRQGAIAIRPRRPPWQEIQRAYVGQMGEGMILEGAEKYQRIAQTFGVPRDSH